MRRGSRRHDALMLIFVLGIAFPRLASSAQDVDGDGPVSPDSADAIRASLDRPPGKPPFGTLDAIALPFRILILPLRLIGLGIAEVAGRAATSEPPRPPVFVQKLYDAGFRPGLGTIGPRSGVAANVRYIGLSPVFLEGAFSIRTSQRYRAGLLFQDLKGNLFEGAYTWRRDAEPYFWGVGPKTKEDAQTDYQWDRQIVSAFYGTQFAGVRLQGQLAHEDNQVGRSSGSSSDLQDNAAFDTLYGVNERVKYVRPEIAVVVDLTRRSGFQQRGLQIELGTALFRGVDGTDSDFHRFNLTLRGYLPVNPRQQLAYQILSVINRDDGGRGVPFYHLARLGSFRGARTLNTDRFRDRVMLALMTEWRYEVWRELHERSRVESILFFDTGSVANRISKITLTDFVLSFGFAFRIVTRRQTLIAPYLAFGTEGPRFHLTFRTAY